MDQFTKSIRIKFDIDEESSKKLSEKVSNIDKKFNLGISDELKEALKLDFGLKEELSELQRVLSEFEGINSDSVEEIKKGLEDRINEIKLLLGQEPRKEKDESKEKQKEKNKISSAIEGISTVSSAVLSNVGSNVSGNTHLSNTLKSFTKDFGDVLGGFSKDWQNGTAQLSAKFLSKLGSILSDALDEMNEMVKYSQLTDEGIRETKFTYGFSSSQAYGFDKAKSIVGISSDESLMYMDDQQQLRFRDAFIKYSEKYTKLADEGFFEKIQEYNFEMEEFKEDLKLEFVDWFMNNKDTIKLTLDAIMTFTSFTIDALTWILKYFMKSESSQSEKSARISDVINNYSSSKSNVVTVTNNNTYNAVNDNGKSLFEESAMQNIKQIKTAIINGL